MGWNLHFFVASGLPCALRMHDGARGGAWSHCGACLVFFSVCFGSGVRMAATNFSAMTCKQNVRKVAAGNKALSLNVFAFDFAQQCTDFLTLYFQPKYLPPHIRVHMKRAGVSHNRGSHVPKVNKCMETKSTLAVCPYH